MPIKQSVRSAALFPEMFLSPIPPQESTCQAHENRGPAGLAAGLCLASHTGAAKIHKSLCQKVLRQSYTEGRGTLGEWSIIGPDRAGTCPGKKMKKWKKYGREYLTRTD
jgi:hypothetical protein